MSSVRGRIAARLAMLALFSAPALGAQQSPGAVPGLDSLRSSVPASSSPRRLLLSAGVGLGTWPSGSVAGVASGWYSTDAVAIGARVAHAGAFIGEQRTDGALLVGARTRDSRRFLLAAIGVGSVSSWESCDGPCGPITRPRAAAVAYSTEGHINFEGLGGGLSMFGALGPRLVRYNAFALTLDIWW